MGFGGGTVIARTGVALCEVREDSGLEVIECVVEAETGGGKGGEGGWVGYIGCYGEKVGCDGSAVLFNEGREKVESRIEVGIFVHWR